jgi:hypothetical protein
MEENDDPLPPPPPPPDNSHHVGHHLVENMAPFAELGNTKIIFQIYIYLKKIL